MTTSLAAAAGILAPEGAHDANEWRRVADRVKREHATIRALADDVERACRALEEGRPGSLERFRLAVSTLHIAFIEHLAIEEAALLPVLEALGAEGKRRAVSMMNEHIEQRRVIRALAESAAVTREDEGSIVVADARALVASFRDDMDAEDRSLQGSKPPPSLAADEDKCR